MGLTSLIKARLDVPGEEGQWVEIRKVPWRKLREAADIQQRSAYEYVKVLGKDGMDAVQGVSAAQIEQFKKDRASNPSVNYDAGVLLRSAIVAWSYSDKPTPEEIDDLDAALVGWLVTEIVALAQPARDEALAKNG